MSDCLHCDINELVEKHLEMSDAVDITELAAKMAESLAELILLAAEVDQAKVIAHTLAHFGDMILQKSGDAAGEVTH
jgi:hypothetical protein